MSYQGLHDVVQQENSENGPRLASRCELDLSLRLLTSQHFLLSFLLIQLLCLQAGPKEALHVSIRAVPLDRPVIHCTLDVPDLG